jgi:transposase
MENEKKEEVSAAEEAATPKPRRRNYSPQEKARLLAESETPGSSVSIVARKYGLSPSLLFRWRQHRDGGGLSGLKAGEPVVPESEAQKLKAQVRELQRLLGKKTEEVEILRAGIELAREKKLLSPAVLSKLEELL